jgi:hypothetical protein
MFEVGAAKSTGRNHPMRHRFTRVCYALAAVVAVTTTLGLSVESAASASTHTVKPNATPSCGATCANLFSERFGFSLVQTSFHNRTAIGTRLVLQQGSNSNTGQDFTVTDIGSVTTLCADWPDPGSFSPTSYACLNYGLLGGFDVFEGNYSPAGEPTNVCAGLATNAHSNEAVTLQTCGQPRTEWIADVNNSTMSFFFGFFLTPWINSSDLPSSHPQVLSVSTRDRSPKHPLTVKPEQQFSDGTVNDGQEWGVIPGVLF